MLTRSVAASFAIALVLVPSLAQAWGQEGHSIVAEIGERRLDPKARDAVAKLLGPGTSLASVSSWADGYRSEKKETSRWHFVSMMQNQKVYEPATHCTTTDEGDCIVAELERTREMLACGTDDAKRREALMFAVHFVGDIHQPLHAAGEFIGGNRQMVAGKLHTSTCGRKGCEEVVRSSNLHSLWDTDLIRWTVYDWGSYVDRLEKTVLQGNDFQIKVVNERPRDWAMQTHAVATLVWPKPSDTVTMQIDDAYYLSVLPLLDQQLALGGVRLARYLNDAFSESCPLSNEARNFAHGSETFKASASNIGELKRLLEAYRKPTTAGAPSQYQLDQLRVIGAAREYIRARLAQGVTKPAVVLDIDETSLDNLPQMLVNDFGYIKFGDCKLVGGAPVAEHGCPTLSWDEQGGAVAIKATQDLFAEFKGKVAFFFITGRRSAEMGATEKNLASAGYSGWERLITKAEDWPSSVSTVNYKASERAKLVAAGYTIVANIGDQPSDLAGGYAERAFLMPNPFYRLP